MKGGFAIATLQNPPCYFFEITYKLKFEDQNGWDRSS
jgi:hypothetical protein